MYRSKVTLFYRLLCRHIDTCTHWTDCWTWTSKVFGKIWMKWQLRCWSWINDDENYSVGAVSCVCWHWHQWHEWLVNDGCGCRLERCQFATTLFRNWRYYHLRWVSMIYKLPDWCRNNFLRRVQKILKLYSAACILWQTEYLWGSIILNNAQSCSGCKDTARWEKRNIGNREVWLLVD